MTCNEIVNITLSSIQKQVSIPLEARFYSMEEVKDILKSFAIGVDHSFYRYLEEESEK